MDKRWSQCVWYLEVLFYVHRSIVYLDLSLMLKTGHESFSRRSLQHNSYIVLEMEVRVSRKMGGDEI